MSARRLGMALVLTSLLAGCAKFFDLGTDVDNPKRRPVDQSIGETLPSVGRVRPSNDLAGLRIWVQMYKSEHDKLPGKLEDLKDVGMDKDDAKLYRALKEGDYVFVPNLRSNAPAGTILCYRKDAPEKGGVVLTTDGGIENLTAPDFQRKLKAGGG